MIALQGFISDYDSYFIVRRSEYAQYTAEDHSKALAFRILASAAVESYVENLCLSIAKIGCDRISKGQPSGAGRALIIWYLSRTSQRGIPIHESDISSNSDLAGEVYSSYSSAVKSNHGIDGKAFRKLVYPIGLRDSQMPSLLVGTLDTMAERRNPASHTYVNRAKSMVEPAEEHNSVVQVMNLLNSVDADLLTISTSFPIQAP